MLAAQTFIMTPETKHLTTKLHRTDNSADNQCQWNWQWRSDEETKPSERVSVVISCDSHISTRVGKHSSASQPEGLDNMYTEWDQPLMPKVSDS